MIEYVSRECEPERTWKIQDGKGVLLMKKERGRSRLADQPKRVGARRREEKRRKELSMR